MAQFNITLTEEELHGLFISNGRDVAVAKLLEKIFLSLSDDIIPTRMKPEKFF